jgi:Co/Zn/Cd efflux system component
MKPLHITLLALITLAALALICIALQWTRYRRFSSALFDYGAIIVMGVFGLYLNLPLSILAPGILVIVLVVWLKQFVLRP